jgi:hypothetical protein
MPSLEASRRNLVKARARFRPPRPWRSRSESVVIRCFVWHWHLGRGPWCSGRALAKWLGISHTYVQKLERTFPMDETAFLREVAHHGAPTLEALRRTREESHRLREGGLLRTQRQWKMVEFRIGGKLLRDYVRTEPNAATLVANNPFLPDAPSSSISNEEKRDYNAIHMWNLRMNAPADNAENFRDVSRTIRRRSQRGFR